MKSTEIEAERVVSTSGLLTGEAYSHFSRRRQTWHPRRRGMKGKRGDSPRAPAPPLSTPSLVICGVHCTQCDSYTDARHTFQHPLICSKRGSVQRRTRPQALRGGRAPSPNPDAALAFSAVGQRWPQPAITQDSDLKIQTCLTY